MNDAYTKEAEQEHLERLRQDWQERQAEIEAVRYSDAERRESLAIVFGDIWGGLTE